MSKKIIKDLENKPSDFTHGIDDRDFSKHTETEPEIFPEMEPFCKSRQPQDRQKLIRE